MTVIITSTALLHKSDDKTDAESSPQGCLDLQIILSKPVSVMEEGKTV